MEVGRRNPGIIEVRNLVKTYGQRRVLDNLSFTIYKDEVFAIIGPSGSGKSTILNILGLLEAPSSGSLLYKGKAMPDINSPEATQFRRYVISYLFQSFALLNDETVTTNLEIGMKYSKGSPEEKKKRIHVMLDRLSLLPLKDEKVSTLSGGEQQRVAMARAVLKPGEIILADEPTGSLDEELGERVFQQLMSLSRDYKKTVVIVTHNLDMAQRCDRVVSLQK